MAKRNTRTTVHESRTPHPGPLNLVLPSPPSVNRWKDPARGKHRGLYMRKTDEFRSYAALVAVKFQIQSRGYGPMEGPLAVTFHWYRPRRTGDLDGRFKCLCDSLNGLAWQDDAQIEEIHAFRHEDKDDPRVVLEIVRLWQSDDEILGHRQSGGPR